MTPIGGRGNLAGVIDDWELWACANTLMRQHAEGAAGVIAERIAALDAAGDGTGARTFERILTRLVILEERAASTGPH